MKKFVSLFLSLISVICIAFAFVGCGGGESSDSGEVDASVYRLDTAYESGWLDEDDLKSIACRQYECYEMEENPYAGMFTQQSDISAKVEKNFKKVYCEQYEIEEPSKLEIVNYYGTYEGNVVVEVNHGLNFRKEIGGVEFINDVDSPVYVLHYPEYIDYSVAVKTLYSLERAYEKGKISEEDLKSISCYFYDIKNPEENPYSGMYEAPTDKLSAQMKSQLKHAYAKQILDKAPEYLDGITVGKYLGTYNGYIVVTMGGERCLIGAPNEGEIGGITFCRNTVSIFVYKK